ncbi:unnamed protein product [Hermetia illucens]|uniref:Uricase n=1 Tax=Hermetia illucens TaxID=343691 RepID=A0A7R8YN54_HERIL|nr:uricase [Hermetia illucens]CAD7079326.1 unnamed protein product [Hermetia illucens]
MFAKRLYADESNVQPNATSSFSEYKITDYGYGKNNVKIMHVRRDGPVHSIREFEVSTHLKLESKKDYTEGDNSDIVATDSQKNTVYVLAQKYGIRAPEEFAILLSSHFLNKYSHVREAHVHIEEYPWERLTSSNGYSTQKHNHAFIFTPVASRFCDVLLKRNSKPIVISGLKDLRVLKTTQSSFVKFVNDEFRTLPDQYDRIFSTIVESRWEYTTVDGVDFCQCWNKVKDVILTTFAGDPNVGVSSPSVQNTLYKAEKTVLDSIPQVGSISMQMPNKHYFDFDTKPFKNVIPGDTNNVFIPVDKPSGIIYAQLDRSGLKSRL